MVTREQVDIALDDERKASFVTKNIDHDVKAISLLRERIPYEKCNSIIGGADHDILYLCDVEDAMPYLTEEDLVVLADCNCFIHNEEYFALFV